jgi:hypothetical protein
MARGSAKLRVVFVLLLGSAVSVFPGRPIPLPFGGPGALSARRSLKNSPIRPQRLRMFHPGQALPLARRQGISRRDPDRHLVTCPIATRSFARFAPAIPLTGLSFASMGHPLRC